MADLSFRERLRVVVGVTLADPVDRGEIVAEFESGQTEQALRHARELANDMRGEFVAVDVWCHKLIWERFACVSYEPWMEVDMPTGIVTNRQSQAAGPDAAEIMERERLAFEREAKKREAQARREAKRGRPKDKPKDAAHH